MDVSVPLYLKVNVSPHSDLQVFVSVPTELQVDFSTSGIKTYISVHLEPQVDILVPLEPRVDVSVPPEQQLYISPHNAM